jgi:hypothetical protein
MDNFFDFSDEFTHFCLIGLAFLPTFDFDSSEELQTSCEDLGSL